MTFWLCPCARIAKCQLRDDQTLRILGCKRLAQFDFCRALPLPPLSRIVPRRKRASARSGLSLQRVLDLNRRGLGVVLLQIVSSRTRAPFPDPCSSSPPRRGRQQRWQPRRQCACSCWVPCREAVCAFGRLLSAARGCQAGSLPCRLQSQCLSLNFLHCAPPLNPKPSPPHSRLDQPCRSDRKRGPMARAPGSRNGVNMFTENAGVLRAGPRQGCRRLPPSPLPLPSLPPPPPLIDKLP